MKGYKKVIVLDEDGIEEEHANALVISGGKEGKIAVKFVRMDMFDIIRATYALVTAVDELGMMPILKKFVEKGSIVLEDIRFL